MDERHASPATVRPPSPFTKPLTIPLPLHPKVHLKQFIEDDEEPTVRAGESNESVEQIDNPDSVLDRQEE